ncbi:alpha/beta hydrolase [Myroides odoratus]|uniref:alpha/beta hydrolase n=1 Tax=Myroides odoratus TaxID=256 RepID=UPI000765BAAF|nr:alpha/beta hydrolase [Myroides odoratus]
MRSFTQIITYDAYNKTETFFTQPLLVIVGNNAGSVLMSEDLINRAASTNKTKYVVDGANHMVLYDGEKEVNEAIGQLVSFFNNKLK